MTCQLQLKPGVRVLGIRPELVLALQVVRGSYELEGEDFCTITSVMDGSHSVGSLHYTGCAVDLRLPVDRESSATIVEWSKKALGVDFDVVLEGDHIHIEYQPKNPY